MKKEEKKQENESNIPEELVDHPELKNVDPRMIELVLNEVWLVNICSL